MIDQWHDFFIMVGGAAAALTGLVFVAMSLNLETIAKDITHRNRAIGTLIGFTAPFIICALALMGEQNYLAIGLEWLAMSSIATAVYIIGYIQARKRGRSTLGLGVYRLTFGTSLYIAELIGAAMIINGHTLGLYIAAIAMLLLLAYTITGAWLLVIGVYAETIKQQSKK
jgi:hypothetical protein